MDLKTWRLHDNMHMGDIYKVAPEVMKTRATQSVGYSLAQKFNPMTLTFDLENQ